MASYEIEWKGSAERDLRNIDRQYIKRILVAIENLADNPYPLKLRKIQSTESFYRIRAGVYRIIYQLDSVQEKVIIYHIRHRKDAYRL
jgi:mRNA interferase RelE/StbE